MIKICDWTLGLDVLICPVHTGFTLSSAWFSSNLFFSFFFPSVITILDLAFYAVPLILQSYLCFSVNHSFSLLSESPRDFLVGRGCLLPFRWSFNFIWDHGHFFFFSALVGVLMTICTVHFLPICFLSLI